MHVVGEAFDEKDKKGRVEFQQSFARKMGQQRQTEEHWRGYDTEYASGIPGRVHERHLGTRHDAAPLLPPNLAKELHQPSGLPVYIV